MHDDIMNEDTGGDMDQFPTPAQIYGASAFESGETESNTVPNPEQEATAAAGDNLPMIVWLRGDEPIADEFVIDAEGAMQMLGIKRSRLTQISGRELRVGRIRIDRYTRPVYRMKDILDYKNWTRSTATHARASAAINDAAKALETRADALNERFENAIQACTSTIQDIVEDENHRMLEAQLDRMNQIEETLCRTASMAGEGLQASFSDIRGVLDGILEKADALPPLKDDLQKLRVALEHVNNLTLDLHTNLKTGQQMQLQFNRDIGKALSLIIEFQREATNAHTSALQQLHQNMEQINQRLVTATNLQPVNQFLQRLQLIKQPQQCWTNLPAGGAGAKDQSSR